jgi:hypothetical protein
VIFVESTLHYECRFFALSPNSLSPEGKKPSSSRSSIGIDTDKADLPSNIYLCHVRRSEEQLAEHELISIPAIVKINIRAEYLGAVIPLSFSSFPFIRTSYALARPQSHMIVHQAIEDRRALSPSCRYFDSLNSRARRHASFSIPDILSFPVYLRSACFLDRASCASSICQFCEALVGEWNNSAF